MRTQQLFSINILGEIMDKIYEDYKCISVIGAGGKSTLIAKIAQVLYDEKIIITTTTKIYKPKDHFFLTEIDETMLANAMKENRVMTVGADLGEKLGCPMMVFFDYAHGYAERILIEADGANRKPMKVPNESEPVYVPNTDCIIAVLGLSALGKPLKEICHRSELAAEILGKCTEDVVSVEDLMKIVRHPKGIFKHAPDVPKKVIFNQLDTILNKDMIKELDELANEYEIYFLSLQSMKEGL